MPHRTLTAPADHRPTAEAASVLIKVPADKDYVVIVRSTVGHLAAQAGFSLADITDLRLAVDEACALLLAPRGLGSTGVGDGELTCRFGVLPDALRVTVSAEAAGIREPDTMDFGWTILSALVDTLSWASDGTTAQVSLEKRRREQTE